MKQNNSVPDGEKQRLFLDFHFVRYSLVAVKNSARAHILFNDENLACLYFFRVLGKKNMMAFVALIIQHLHTFQANLGA